MSALARPEFDYTWCANCGVEFGSPVVAMRRKDGASLYCPNGHNLHFGSDAFDKLKAERDKAIQDKWAAEQKRQLAVADLVKTQKKLKRVEKRIKNGVCPCCTRHFTNLERHIASKHPDFTTEVAQ